MSHYQQVDPQRSSTVSLTLGQGKKCLVTHVFSEHGSLEICTYRAVCCTKDLKINLEYLGELFGSTVTDVTGVLLASNASLKSLCMEPPRGVVIVLSP